MRDEKTGKARQVIERRKVTPDHIDSEIDRFPLAESYGRMRAHFKHRPAWYGRYQGWLMRARIPESYDSYLARAVNRSIIAVGITWFILIVGGFVLAYGTASPFAITIRTIGGVFIVGSVVGAILLTGLVAYPWYRARKRRATMDKFLPHAVVFMHALSQIDPNPVEIISDVADHERIYGELALEFEMIRKDITVLNDDLLQAIENAQIAVPSADLRTFLDDLSGLLESGGTLENFLAHEVDTQLEGIEDDLEEFLDRLATLAPLFVVLVSVGPVIILVVLIVIGLMGGDVVSLLFLVTYIGIPTLIIGSVVAIDEMMSPYRLPVTGPHQSTRNRSDTRPSMEEGTWFEQYHKQQRRREILDQFATPLKRATETPLYTLILTIPISGAVIGSAIVSGALGTDWATFVADPLVHTTGYVVIPWLIMTTPIMILYESQARKQRSFESRLPDALRSLASSNQRDIPFDEAIELVARRFDGPVANEFHRTYRDIQLNNNTRRALADLANRQKNQRVRMTIEVVQKIVGASRSIDDSLRTLAHHLELRNSLERNRREEMKLYTIIVAMGILVYLLIIAVLDTYLFAQIVDIENGGDSPFGGDIPLATFDVIFIHSAVILALGSGLILGKLIDDSMQSGLKYMNALALVVIAVFFLVRLL